MTSERWLEDGWGRGCPDPQINKQSAPSPPGPWFSCGKGRWEPSPPLPLIHGVTHPCGEEGQEPGPARPPAPPPLPPGLKGQGLAEPLSPTGCPGSPEEVLRVLGSGRAQAPRSPPPAHPSPPPASVSWGVNWATMLLCRPVLQGLVSGLTVVLMVVFAALLCAGPEGVKRNMPLPLPLPLLPAPSFPAF